MGNAQAVVDEPAQVQGTGEPVTPAVPIQKQSVDVTKRQTDRHEKEYLETHQGRNI
jgi:hypothetical protein